MKRRAFTLVELLVVVAIIAVLVAILMPVMPRSGHNTARKSSCQYNLKQISLGFKQYQNDYDDYYPLIFGADAPNSKAPYGWADALQPYIKNTQVYQCPSDAFEGNENPTQAGYSDYWCNANLMRHFNYKGKIIFRSGVAHGRTSPSQFVLIGEGGTEKGTPTGNARYNQCGDGTSLSGRNQVCALSPSLIATYPSAQIHLDGANFAFADGHVKWLRGNSPTQSANVLSNGLTQKTISETANAGKATFSLLAK